MSALMEQHERHQIARERLWGGRASRRPTTIPAEAARAAIATFDAGTPASEYAPFNFYKPPNARAIVKLVSLKHGLHITEILGASRLPRIVAARHESMWLVHSHCPWLSIPEVGRIFDRDHTTVLYAIAKITGKRERTDG
jgi:hypothetical protein